MQAYSHSSLSILRGFRAALFLSLSLGALAPLAARAVEPKPPLPSGPKSFLATNEYITSGTVGLTSPGKHFTAGFQPDGNFCVIYAQLRTQVWCTNTNSGGSAAFAIMQGDGNFCVYKGTDPGHNEGGLFCSMSNGGSQPYALSLDESGSLSVLNGAAPGAGVTARWSTPPMMAKVTVTPPSNGIIVMTKADGVSAGIDCGNNPDPHTQCSVTLPASTALTVQAIPQTNWALKGWSYVNDCWATTATSCPVTLWGDFRIAAGFKDVTPRKVTVGTMNAGTVAFATNGTSQVFGNMWVVPNGQTVTLTATGAATTAFKYWSGACANQGATCTLTMDGDKATMANFFLKP